MADVINKTGMDPKIQGKSDFVYNPFPSVIGGSSQERKNEKTISTTVSSILRGILSDSTGPR